MGIELRLERVQDRRRCSISRDERVGVCALRGIVRILNDGLGKVTPMDVQQDLVGSLITRVNHTDGIGRTHWLPEH